MTNEVIRVLIVDDNPSDRDLVARLLRRYPRVTFEVTTASNGAEFIDAIQGTGLDLVLLDYSLPGEDGITLLKRVQGADAPPIIMLTGHGDERIAVEAMRHGAYDYFPKSSISSQVLAQAIHQAIDKYRLDAQLECTEQVIFTLAAAVEAKDPMTRDHVDRMAKLAPRLGEALGLDVRQQKFLRYGGILHDIGKVGVSELIIRKASPLTPDEWAEVYQHPVIGERICAPLRFAAEVGPIIRHHHERWDGHGYVDGLAGEDIPLLARVMSVVDAYDAMSKDRPYRNKLAPEETRRRLQAGAGTQWDPEIVHAFLRLLDADDAQVAERMAAAS